ncbi:ferritin family protein [Chloroflexota bacterium]
MTVEQEKTIIGLKYAIQMEIDGKEYYLKASEKSSQQMGKKLLQSLAAEEDIHRRKFEQIYNAIQNKQDWPGRYYQPDGGKALRTIFARATEKLATTARASATELESVQGAIDMEVKSYDYYKERSSDASYAAEKDFYEAVATQERQHQLVLLDYYEYLRDPAAWFVKTEHPSLDGG